MELGNFIKITNAPKNAAAAPVQKPAIPGAKPQGIKQQSSLNLSTLQMAGIGLIAFGLILVGIAMATW